MTSGDAETRAPIDDLEFLRTVRRAIHRWPETGHSEHRTAAFVSGVLTGLGYRVLEPAPTSVAVLAGPVGRPAVALRAEMDAIECAEQTGLPFASRRPGLMHACGHDGHAAALITLASRLAARPPTAPALLIFQQAEEAYPAGARLVIEGLGPDAWPARYVYGCHLWPELPEGVIGLRGGALLAGVTGLVFTFRARAGRSHGTAADIGGSDALAALWKLSSALADLPRGRRVSTAHPVAVHAGQAQVGEGPNRPARNGTLRATMRWIDRAEHDRVLSRIRDMVTKVSGSTAVAIDLTVQEGIRPLVANDAGAVRRVRTACLEAGLDVRAYPAEPVGVSDDFGEYSAAVPGALFLVGCGQRPNDSDLHSSSFDFREEVLIPVVDVMERLVRQA